MDGLHIAFGDMLLYVWECKVLMTKQWGTTEGKVGNFSGGGGGL